MDTEPEDGEQPFPEAWKDVLGYEGYYRVSDQGRVYSVPRETAPRGRYLSLRPCNGGYCMVTLSKDGTRARVRVHVLVAAAFLGPRPAGAQIRHLDGDPSNNRASNLKYGTPSQNLLDQVGHGRHHETRKTHCPQGHPYDLENTYRLPSRPGTRYCRACIRKASRESMARARRRAENRD